MIREIIIPPIPSDEMGRSTLDADCLVGIPDELVEEEFCDCYGRIQVIGNEITRDMPESHAKSAIAGLFNIRYGPYLVLRGWILTTGTDGTRFENNWLLSPDFSVWTFETRYERNVGYHLYQKGSSPIMVFECEWIQEVNGRKKGIDKIHNYYFHPTCVGNAVNNIPTKVKEAWLFAIDKNQPIQFGDMNYNDVQNDELVKTTISWIPLLGPLFDFLVGEVIEFCYAPTRMRGRNCFGLWLYVRLLLATIGRILCHLFYDVVSALPNPPDDSEVPYLAIFYRDDPQHMYFHMLPNKVFLPPRGSNLYYAAPMWTNDLYRVL